MCGSAHANWFWVAVPLMVGIIVAITVAVLLGASAWGSSHNANRWANIVAERTSA